MVVRIYMDVCCLNRPFDDLSHDRIYLEAEAVLSITSRCERGDWTLVGSGAIAFELSKLRDIDRLERVKAIYAVSTEYANVTLEAEQRAIDLQRYGLKNFDSLHVALAESYGVDVFLTTDDHLLKAASRVMLGVKIANPILWLMEVTAYEQ